MSTLSPSWRWIERRTGAAPSGVGNALGWWALGLAGLLPVLAAMARYPNRMALMALGVVAFAALAAAVFWRPAWGACALIVLVYWNASDVINETFGFAWLLRLVIAGVVAVWLLDRMLRGEHRRLRWPLLAPLLLWGGVQVLCTLTATDRGVAAGSLLDYAKALGVFYIVVNLLPSPRWWRWGTDALLAATGLLSLPVLYQGLSGSHNTFWGFGSMKYAAIVPGQFAWRLGGALQDPNFLAMSLVAALPLAAVEALEPRAHWFRRLWALGIMVLALGAALFTYSRGAAVGLALMVVVLLVAHPRRKWVLVAALAGGLVATAVAPQTLWGRLSTLVENSITASSQQMTDSSFRNRRHEMYTGVLMFLHHPLLGVGPGNFEVDYFQYAAMAGLSGENMARDPHSLYTQLLAEQGLIGMAAFVWLLVCSFRLLERGRRRARTLGAAVLARLVGGFELALTIYLVCSIFLHSAYFRHFLLLLALGALGALLALEARLQERASAARAAG